MVKGGDVTFAPRCGEQGKPVAVALMRVFGSQLAELPLVATRGAARRQGHARILVAACEELLAAVGVSTVSLPAASSTVRCRLLIWVTCSIFA